MALNLFTRSTSGQLLNKGFSDFEADLYEEWVAEDYHAHYGNKTTTSIVRLKSGFEIVGVSSCENASKFESELGYLYALKDALNKLGEFAAFHRAELKRYEAKNNMTELRIDVQLSPFEIEELRRLLADTKEGGRVVSFGGNLEPHELRDPSINPSNKSLHKLNY